MAFWLDCYSGETVTFAKMMDDLAQVDVIYLGERHTLQRHHDLHEKIIQELGNRGLKVTVGLEQMENFLQGKLDKYNDGEIDFATLAKVTNWKKRWSNYDDYRGLIEAAKDSGGRILALNAKKELVRQVGRKGLKALAPALKKQLPSWTKTKDDWHERKVALKVQVHAAMKPAMMKSVIEAQTLRDETMAAVTAKALRRKGSDEVIVVICGSGHCNHCIGIPERVKARVKNLKERIVHFTESGFLKLSAAMKKHARNITITHEQMRFLQRPIADYIHCHEPKKK